MSTQCVHSLSFATVILSSFLCVSTAFAQQVFLGSTKVERVVVLAPYDIYAHALITKLSDPASNDPQSNNCAYGVVYFGSVANPVARDRLMYQTLLIAGATGSTVGLYYTKGGPLGPPPGVLCTVDRVDLRF
jgi:hypothetical protein